MGKPTKSKNGKVPKITEEEYTAYLASLREMSGGDEEKSPSSIEKEE
ncbi:MAG: hypothetical protein IKD15_00980 [Clostridia bacterium]|nr:hypothetical protein [Clostridia bacterium]